MSEQNQGVVELQGAGVPADQGLSSLGLLMQLAGNVLAAYGAMIAFTMLVAMSGFGASKNGETLWMIVLFGACITRSIFHRNAGTKLLYGESSLTAGPGSNQRMSGIRTYIIVSLLQTGLVGAMLLGKFKAPEKLVAGIVLGLLVWPVTLAILMQLPRFKRFKDDLPLTEDKGFEGASILMTVLGLCGLVAGGTLLLVLLDMPGRALSQGFGILLLLALVMLVIRSVLHVQAGLSGLRETNVDRSVELANRYANFGVISAFCVGGAMLMMMMSGMTHIIVLVVIVSICWMLMAWPLTIRRFFSDRQFADLLAGDEAHPHRRAPDAGLTGLGWLLFGHAVFTASFLIPQILLGGDRGMRELDSLMALGGATGLRSVWFSVGVVVLQGWAGFELIRMSPQSRIIASVFGVVGAVVTVYINWPMIEALKQAKGLLGNSDAILLGPMAIALIIPVATLVLVNRKIAPTARARFRTKPTETAPVSPTT